MFLIGKDINITSSADDNKHYDTCNTIEKVILSLQGSSKKLFEWFSENQMKGKAGKYCFLINPKESVDIQLGSSVTVRSDCVKMLGVKIHYKLNFDENVKT